MAFSDGVECPHCHTRLEVAPGGRMIASTAGLAAGWIAWHLAPSSSNLGFALPVLYAFLAFGIVSPLVLMFTAGLRPAPPPPVAAPATAHGSHGHGAHH